MEQAVIRVTDVEPISMRRRALVDAFLAGRNRGTLEAYQRSLGDFARFVGAPDAEAAAKVLIGRGHGEANGLALEYRAHLIERGLQAATINRHLAALRSAVAFAQTLGLVSWELKVPNLKAETFRDTRGPGREGFRLMLAAATNDRDRCILRLLHDLALRRSELLGLDVADLDLEGGAVWILGKGRSQMERLTLPEPTRAALTAWMAVRGSQAGPLFTNFDRAKKGSGRLSGTAVWQIVRKLGERAGFTTMRPHGLRHGAITEALDQTNGNVRAVQRFSRHRDLRVLLIYDDARSDMAGVVARLVAA
jgi:integrase/recombinase XerC